MTPHHAFPDVSWADLRAELQREISHRKGAFEGMIGKGRITKAAADRELDIFAAILEDCERFRKAVAPVGEGRPAVNPLSIERTPGSSLHAYTWHERRSALTRELEYRERIYPAWIQKGRIKPDDAALYCRRLTCMRALYELGYDWTSRSGARCRFAALERTAQEQDALEEWLAIETEIAARDGRAQQELAV